MSSRLHPRMSASLLSMVFCLLADGFLTAATAQNSSLAELFQKAKADFKMAAYGSSLENLRKLDELSQTSGFEKERVRLAPAISFYRAANLAALGRKEDARKEFGKYLVAFPNADLDRNAFPRAVIEAFERAREDFAARAVPPPAKSTARDEGIRATYASFHPAPGSSPTTEDGWASGPIRYLMTKVEKLEWDKISDSSAKAAFVVKFWQVRDPTPLTPENEFREEFEKRVAFADTYFTVEEKKGGESDRGLVFALLGPPTYIAQFPLMSQDDPVQAARAAPIRQSAMNLYDPRHGSTVYYAEQTPLTAMQVQGVREVWHYGRGEIPRGVPFQEIDFQFITKEGYGVAVLQRDERTLLALEAAAQRSQSRN